jgi:hypothetical protein
MNNASASYFNSTYELSTKAFATTASIVGWMNLAVVLQHRGGRSCMGCSNAKLVDCQCSQDFQAENIRFTKLNTQSIAREKHTNTDPQNLSLKVCCILSVSMRTNAWWCYNSTRKATLM